MPQYQLQLRRVTKSYANRRALDSVDLECVPGEFFVLFGPSGAGKSTLLRTIAGIEHPDFGDVLIEDRNVVDLPASKRNVAMAFESYALYPHLSVRENLNFPLVAPPRRLPASERVDRIARVANLLEIASLLERYPYQLSGGQRQRVSLGRALVRDASVTLLDEPIAHLDARLRHSLRGELKNFQKSRQATTIYATPDYFEAFAVADRIGVIIDGRLRQVGTPDEIYGRPVDIAVAALVGDPHMNIFAVDGQGRAKVGGQSIQLLDINSAVVAAGVAHVGLRPSGIEILLEGKDPLALPATTIMVDPIGQEAIVGLELDPEGTAVARTSLGNPPIGARQRVWIRPDWRQAYYFDASGLRIKDVDRASVRSDTRVGAQV
jgi:multiple sugar transport system ATP-binding protein